MMKRFLLFITLLTIVTGIASAQAGLAVDRLFGSQYKKQKNAIEVMVRGRELRPYKLTLFRSITVKGNTDEFFAIEQCVRQDAAKATDKETGMIGNHIYYGFYLLPWTGAQHRYLFFRNSSLHRGGAREATLVYMEGTATIDELKNMFR